MPELPEVETIVKGLRTAVVGKRLKAVDLFLPKTVRHGDLTDLIGRKLNRVDRIGKLMFLGWSGGLTLLWHLKMTGQVLLAPPDAELVRHTHVRFGFHRLDLRFVDLRQFGYLKVTPTREAENEPEVRALGPDALQIDRAVFLSRLSRRTGRIKPLLLNQSFISGLGNIYVDEALFKSGIHPLTPAGELTDGRRQKLFAAFTEVLTEAVRLGGSSISNFRDIKGSLGYFQNSHQVYRRTGEPCKCCGQAIERIKLGGRGTHFCPECQPMARRT